MVVRVRMSSGIDLLGDRPTTEDKACLNKLPGLLEYEQLCSIAPTQIDAIAEPVMTQN